MERAEKLRTPSQATHLSRERETTIAAPLTMGKAAHQERSNETLKLAALALAGVCAFLDLYAPQPVLPMLREIFHTTAAEIGWTISATTLGVALAAPVAGIVADRVGRRRTIVACLFGLSIPTMLAATASTLPALVFWRFIAGLFMPGIITAALAYVAEEWEGRESARAVTTYITGTVLGGFAGRMLTGVLAEHGGWRTSFVDIGAMTLIGAVAVSRWLPAEQSHSAQETWFATDERYESAGVSPFCQRLLDTLPARNERTGRRAGDEGERRRSLASFTAHLRNPLLIATYAVGFSVLFSLVATFTFITFHLAAAPYRLGPIAQGALFFVYLLGLVVTPASSAWMHRYGQRLTLTIAVLASSVGVLLTLSGPLWLVVAGLALCSSGVFVCQAAASSFVGIAASQAKAAAAGLYVTFYYIGGSAGAVLPGLLWKSTGWTGCVALIVAVQLIAGAVAYRYWRTPVSTAAIA